MAVPLLWASSEQLLATLLILSSVVEEGLLVIHFQPAWRTEQASFVPSGCCCFVRPGLSARLWEIFLSGCGCAQSVFGAQLAENSTL